MTDLAEIVAELQKKVEALEDERAIQAVLTRYGFAVDSGDADGTAHLYAEDCHVDIDNASFMDGRDATRGIVTSPLHQSIMPNCAHVMGPFAVKLDGARAVATGYATVYVREDGQVRVWRQSYGRWELVKRDGRWQILRRTSRSVGHDEAQAMLNAGL
jgi:uncharacterized protein (TIGR02246 family)